MYKQKVLQMTKEEFDQWLDGHFILSEKIQPVIKYLDKSRKKLKVTVPLEFNIDIIDEKTVLSTENLLTS